MDIESQIRTIVREELAGIVPVGSSDPELITIADAAKLCGVSKSVVEELHRDRGNNDFPSVQLGPRTIKIDKRRLNQWIAAGGLGVSAEAIRTRLVRKLAVK